VGLIGATTNDANEEHESGRVRSSSSRMARLERSWLGRARSTPAEVFRGGIR
jgi:hypothetical protein